MGSDQGAIKITQRIDEMIADINQEVAKAKEAPPAEKVANKKD
jgi:hypothetical protein